jgi:hypothetical protein
MGRYTTDDPETGFSGTWSLEAIKTGERGESAIR